MRVCHCHRVSDREIVSLVHEGVDSVAGIGDFCGAATGCGGCRGEVQRLIVETRAADTVETGVTVEVGSLGRRDQRLAISSHEAPSEPQLRHAHHGDASRASAP